MLRWTYFVGQLGGKVKLLFRFMLGRQPLALSVRLKGVARSRTDKAVAMVNLIRGLSIKTRMRPHLIVMFNPLTDIVPCLLAVFKGVQINTFILQ